MALLELLWRRVPSNSILGILGNSIVGETLLILRPGVTLPRRLVRGVAGVLRPALWEDDFPRPEDDTSPLFLFLKGGRSTGIPSNRDPLPADLLREIFNSASSTADATLRPGVWDRLLERGVAVALFPTLCIEESMEDRARPLDLLRLLLLLLLLAEVVVTYALTTFFCGLPGHTGASRA